jgi:hypothetical protein
MMLLWTSIILGISVIVTMGWQWKWVVGWCVGLHSLYAELGCLLREMNNIQECSAYRLIMRIVYV